MNTTEEARPSSGSPLTYGSIFLNAILICATCVVTTVALMLVLDRMESSSAIERYRAAELALTEKNAALQKANEELSKKSSEVDLLRGRLDALRDRETELLRKIESERTLSEAEKSALRDQLNDVGRERDEAQHALKVALEEKAVVERKLSDAQRRNEEVTSAVLALNSQVTALRTQRVGEGVTATYSRARLTICAPLNSADAQASCQAEIDEAWRRNRIDEVVRKCIDEGYVANTNSFEFHLVTPSEVPAARHWIELYRGGMFGNKHWFVDLCDVTL